MTQLTSTTTSEQQDNGFRCLICHQHHTASPYDACDDCKARMFDEYLAVQGGF